MTFLERVKSKKLVIWKATYLVNEKSKFFRNVLIILGDLFIGEKDEDVLEAV